MSKRSTVARRRGPIALSELTSGAIAPVTARRGFATADLVAAWPEIAGSLHADYTAPEKILWPRRSDGDEPAAGVLVLKVDGPRAILVQHDLPQIVERVNAFLGYKAISRARIVQSPVSARERPIGQQTMPPLAPADKQALEARIASVDNDELRRALAKLGRGVLGSRRD
ncbi:MAG: DUF721 domain-containing protein [Hyphomicrobiales bacterium]|nr:DUF721 domain-containing protein [Hyphomicrobiales bacterium]